MRPGLERIEALLDALGHPEPGFTHRPGRRHQRQGLGGRRCWPPSSRPTGRRVGLYTSPHLVRFRERIRVDGEAIAEDVVVDGVDALGTLIARLRRQRLRGGTALALDHFARERVDVAVLEVGLGGRFDATTVGRPRCRW